MTPTNALPRISIVTPNLNGGAFLERTLRSVLDQNYPNLEYIVVDGGSADGSREILERYRDQLTHLVIEADHGHYDAIAKGFRLATGEIVAWINSDDIYMPWTFQAVAELFREFPTIEWLMGLPTLVHEGAIKRTVTHHPRPRKLIEGGLYRPGRLGYLQQESGFWKRSLYERAGGLRTDLKLAGDFALWIQFAKHAELVTTSAVLGGFSFHDANRSKLLSSQYASEVRQICAELPLATKRAANRIGFLLQKHRHIRRYAPRLSGLFSLLFRFCVYSGPTVVWSPQDFRYHLDTARLPLAFF